MPMASSCCAALGSFGTSRRYAKLVARGPLSTMVYTPVHMSSAIALIGVPYEQDYGSRLAGCQDQAGTIMLHVMRTNCRIG